MGTAIGGSTPTLRPDFGWQLGGQSVSLLSERTLSLDLRPLLHGIPCYQCGVCTAACALAASSRRFPRRTLALIQLGLRVPTYRDTEAWECHGCGDCTAACPNLLGPGRQLADLRQQAVREAARPRWLAEGLDRWYGLALAVAAAGLATTGLAAIFGVLVVPGPVRYAGFLPHGALVPAFGGLVAASGVGLGLAAARAWRWYRPGPTPLRTVLSALARVSWDALLHRQHGACPDGGARARAHAAVFLSFLGLLLLAAGAAATVLLGGQYPFPLGHPAKIAGNVLGTLLIAGTGWMLAERLRQRASDQPSRPFDLFLPVALFLIAVTGVALEICRVLDLRSWAYPLYVGHLAWVAVLLGLLPFTKLAHAVHRVVALASLNVATPAQRGSRRPVAPRVRAGAATAQHESSPRARISPGSLRVEQPHCRGSA